ncbi:MAG: choice-of-anchor J domain-containing protein [Flavobacteriaceae bacterium]|jgi:hypothetical protein|nr:choice-of-anchor J domain-containing protein [Flavobacteriaceae bacterium]MDA7727898.1 choice-of-anchor J domain-containing protein [Flavobacteriaceae bacterium]MDG1308925.1 choice-of-anchor J domain-containing protein [Flavobacteriaceae bacterium]
MKKIIYLLTLSAFVFTACAPNEDINAEIDAQDNPIVGDATYTFTDEDYEALELGFGSFSSVDDAKTMIAPYLQTIAPFQYWGNGSSVTVNYELYVGSADGVSDYTYADSYEFSNADYAATGSNAFGFYPNVDPNDEIPAVLDAQIMDATEGQILLVEYDQYIDTPDVGLTNLYQASFPANFDDFELIDASGSLDAWTTGSSNVQGSGFSSGAQANEEWLISPEVDLSDGSDLLFQITQEIDFLGDESLIDILIATDYIEGGDVASATWTALSFDKTIYGSMTTSEDFDFSAYDGETIHIALKYSSTDSDSPRWRVQDFAVKAIGISGDAVSYGTYYMYSGGAWELAENVYYLSSADFDSMGEGSGEPGRFDNFSSSVSPNSYLPAFLAINFPYGQEEEELIVTYAYYSSSSGAQVRGNLYTFTDGAWMAHQSTISTSLQFGHDGTQWVPDNTIRYTLVDSDYDVVASTLLTTAGFEDAAGNLDNYGNFNRTGGGSSWSDEMMFTAMGVMLDNLDPSAADGQKYITTYNIYDGSSGTEDRSLIKEAGVWIQN